MFRAHLWLFTLFTTDMSEDHVDDKEIIWVNVVQSKSLFAVFSPIRNIFHTHIVRKLKVYYQEVDKFRISADPFPSFSDDFPSSMYPF